MTAKEKVVIGFVIVGICWLGFCYHTVYSKVNEAGGLKNTVNKLHEHIYLRHRH